MKLRFAPATERFITTYDRTLPQAVLLTGPQGIGLATLANHLAGRSGTIMSVVQPESKTTALPSIAAERIRDLYDQTKSRLKGANFVIIDGADTMNHVAQNALLKLLEEPNDSVRFILTSHDPDRLLPTIRSRVQMFVVPPIDTLESRRLLGTNKNMDDLTIQRLLFVADGLPARLTGLMNGETDFKRLSERVQAARQIVEGTPYQRLALVLSFSGDRHDAVELIETVILLLRKSVASNPERSTICFIERMVRAIEAIRSNGNVKLHLGAAMV